MDSPRINHSAKIAAQLFTIRKKRPMKSNSCMTWYPKNRCHSQLPAGFGLCATKVDKGQVSKRGEGERLTSYVLSAKLVRTFPFWQNHQNRTCSAAVMRSSNSLMNCSKLIVSWTSRSRKAGSHWSVTFRISPVAPSPQSVALKRPGRSVAEQVTLEPSARSSVNPST